MKVKLTAPKKRVRISAPSNRYFPASNFPPADNGLSILWGGNAQKVSDNPYDGGTIQFNGQSHEDGGIGAMYNNNPVEVEGQETAVKGADGDLTIMGNMNIPGTGMKFKIASQKIAKAEQKASGILDKSTSVLNNTDPRLTKFDGLKFNAAKVMAIGSNMKLKQLASQKSYLTDLQQAMLDTANERGLDPQEMSKGNIKKAKYGARLMARNGYKIPKFQDGGDPGDGVDSNPRLFSLKMALGRAESGNRYNLKGRGTAYGRYQFTKPTRDNYYNENKDYFKSLGINSVQDFENSFKSDPSIQERVMDIHLSHLNNEYNGDLQKIATAHRIGEGAANSLFKNGYFTLDGKKLSYDNPIDTSTTGTESVQDYVNKVGTFSRGYRGENNSVETFDNNDNAPRVNTGPQPQPLKISPIQGKYPDVSNIGPAPDKIVGTGVIGGHYIPPNPLLGPQKLPLSELSGEMYGLATNRLIGPQARYFTPQLYTPYQVSLQDQLNRNQSTFGALSKQLANSPEALSELAAQKYRADQEVLGNQFRTNQGITQDIANKNIGLVNEANLRNLGIADQQYVRGQQAISNTKNRNQEILNSVSSKLLQNRLENREFNAYQSIYPKFGFDPNSNQVVFTGGGGNPNLGATGYPSQTQGSQGNIQMDPSGQYRIRTDPNTGKVMSVETRSYNPYQQAREEQQIQEGSIKLANQLSPKGKDGGSIVSMYRQKYSKMR